MGVYYNSSETYRETYNFLCNSELSPYKITDGLVGYVPACPFPYVNKGFKDDSLWVDGDCSMTNAEVIGSEYDLTCRVYNIFTGLIFVYTIYNLSLFRKRRLAKSSLAPISSKEKEFMAWTICGFGNFMVSVDLFQHYGLWNEFMYGTFVGLSINGLLYVVMSLVESWVSIISSKGKVTVVPKWLTNLKYFCTISFLVGENGVACLEYVMGGQENPLTGQMVNNSDLSNVFNGTTNSIKNIFVGILITIWATISVRAGREISAKLGQGSKSDGPTEEQKKISKYCKLLAYGSFAGVAYKFLFGFLRISTVAIYPDPPCGNSWVSIVTLLLTFLNYVAVFLSKPKSANAGKGKVASSASSTSTTVDKT